MVIELNDHDSRLIYSTLLNEAQEHFTYASTSDVAERLYELAARFARPLATVANRDSRCPWLIHYARQRSNFEQKARIKRDAQILFSNRS